MTPAEQIDRDVAFIINYHLETPAAGYHANHLYAGLLKVLESGQSPSAAVAQQTIALYALGKLIELAHTPAAGAFQGRAALYLANCLKTGHCGNLHPLSPDAVGLLNPEEFALLKTAASYAQRQTPRENPDAPTTPPAHKRLSPPGKLYDKIIRNTHNSEIAYRSLNDLCTIFERGCVSSATLPRHNASTVALHFLKCAAITFSGSEYRNYVMQYLNRCIQWQRDSQGHALSPTIQRNLKQALQQIVMDTYPPPPRGGAKPISP